MSAHLIAEGLSSDYERPFSSKSIQKFRERGFDALGSVVNTLESVGICIKPRYVLGGRHGRTRFLMDVRWLLQAKAQYTAGSGAECVWTLDDSQCDTEKICDILRAAASLRFLRYF